MISLSDIVPQRRTVRISAGDLELRGLGLREIADLFLQFPILQSLVTEGAAGIALSDLITQAPNAVGFIIAQAADQPAAAEAVINGKGLPPDDLMACLSVIREMTFPRGINPFWEAVVSLLSGQYAAATPDLSVPKPPNGSLPPDISPAT